MKTKVLIAFVFLMVISTQLLAQRPSIAGLDQKLNILIDALVVCPPGAPTRFVDNGDGTICDHQTGLMWEKKDAADGVQDLLRNPHDVDNLYTWSDLADGDDTNPDGTAFTDFLPRLNGELAMDNPPGAGNPQYQQLAGYSDWRLPTIAELDTLRDCSEVEPTVPPVFLPSLFFYFSFTSAATEPDLVWVGDFTDNCELQRAEKVNNTSVRAVRGGR